MNNQWRDNAHHSVVWADGTYDSKRICDACDERCSYPVHTDHYKVIGYDDLGLSEDTDDGPYWDYMQKEAPLGGSLNAMGELITPEFYTSNPDGLAEVATRSSGVSEEQHEWMQEAFEALTPKQQEVWQLVMREQLSLTEVAQRLGITKQVVDTHVKRATSKIAEFLREKHEGDK